GAASVVLAGLVAALK
ncbi:hypothetical protein L195_g061410, partial [Trifolium pratense]